MARDELNNRKVPYKDSPNSAESTRILSAIEIGTYLEAIYFIG